MGALLPWTGEQSHHFQLDWFASTKALELRVDSILQFLSDEKQTYHHGLLRASTLLALNTTFKQFALL